MFVIRKMNEPVCVTDLPYTIQDKIFQYLDIDDLLRVGRTCRRWYYLSRNPRFWTHVDTKDCNLKTMSFSRLNGFLPFLHPKITHLKLRFMHCHENALTVSKLFLPIKERCPNLQVLMFHVVLISYSGFSNKNFCVFDHLPPNIRVFACHQSEMESLNFKRDENSLPIYPLEVLDFSASALPRDQGFFDVLNRMVHLKELRFGNSPMWDNDILHIDPLLLSNLRILDLEGALISFEGFNYIKRSCDQLVELYLCSTSLTDNDIHLESESNFQHLEIICLRRSAITDFGIKKFLRCCYSLKHIYVSYPSRLPNSFVVPSLMTGRVVVCPDSSSCKHYSKRNYMKDKF